VTVKDLLYYPLVKIYWGEFMTTYESKYNIYNYKFYLCKEEENHPRYKMDGKYSLRVSSNNVGDYLDKTHLEDL